jgi:hypothetical protein
MTDWVALGVDGGRIRGICASTTVEEEVAEPAYAGRLYRSEDVLNKPWTPAPLPGYDNPRNAWYYVIARDRTARRVLLYLELNTRPPQFLGWYTEDGGETWAETELVHDISAFELGTIVQLGG